MRNVNQVDVLRRWTSRIRKIGKVYRKTMKVHAKQTHENGSVGTIVNGELEGTKSYLKGDFIMVGSRGGKYAMAENSFRSRYDVEHPKPASDVALAAEGFQSYAPTSWVWAYELSGHDIEIYFPTGIFTGKWGGQVDVEETDVLAMPYPNGDEVYVIKKPLFAISYTEELDELQRKGRRRARRSTALAYDSRIPLRVAVAFLILTLGIVSAAVFLLQDIESYPFGDWDHHCRPCKCDADGMLLSCDIPAKMRVTSLYLDHKHIKGITPGAFDEVRASLIGNLELSYNSITTLQTNSFRGLTKDLGVGLSSNNISVIEMGAFRESNGIRTLSLHGNALAVLVSGAFDGLEHLRFLFLDSNRLRLIEEGVFDDTPYLKAVWLGENALAHCTYLIDATAPDDQEIDADGRATLPSDATCVDHAQCAVQLHSLVGNGYCDENGFNTDECLWDGGDCTAVFSF